MDEDYTPPYSPADLAAIRAAREELYAAQRARRVRYLKTGRWTPQLDMPPAVPFEGDPVVPPPAATVELRREDLDAARAAARDNARK